MSETMRVVRGYRPSCTVRPETDERAHEPARLANLERYMMRARAGMPIFDSDEAPLHSPTYPDGPKRQA